MNRKFRDRKYAGNVTKNGDIKKSVRRNELLEGNGGRGGM